MNNAVKTVRLIIKNTGSRLDAVRYLRSLGLTFQTARTMVDEIVDGAPWYRNYR